MATKTTNLNLTKPGLDDSIELSVLNKNLDIIDAAVGGKVDKEEGKGLSSNDFTDAEKTKLSGLENYDDTDVKAYIAAVSSQAAINKTTLGYQAKNLLPNTLTAQTKNGVTVTVDANGIITTSGTATPSVTFVAGTFNAKAGVTYTLNGCPTGGDPNTYRLDVRYYKSGTIVNINNANDVGNGVSFVKPTDADDDRILIYIRVQTGTDMSSKTFKPMVRYADITDSTYEPYRPSVEERLAALEAAVMGGGIT